MIGVGIYEDVEFLGVSFISWEIECLVRGEMRAFVG